MRMRKTNLTVRLDEDVVRRARVAAARRGTSISALVAQQITDLADQDERYEVARRQVLELMERATAHGGRNWTREDIYAERLDRCGKRG
jgi:hypothetical protein